MTLFGVAGAEPLCPIFPKNPNCPTIQEHVKIYNIRPYSGGFRFTTSSDISDSLLFNSVSSETTVINPAAFPYIPPLHDCNYPITLDDPGAACDPYNTFMPYRAAAAVPDTFKYKSYLSRDIVPGGNITYHISSTYHQPTNTVTLNKLMYDFGAITKSVLVFDYHHYPLSSPPSLLNVSKSYNYYGSGMLGKIKFEFDYDVLGECSKPSDTYNNGKHLLEIKNTATNETVKYRIKPDITVTRDDMGTIYYMVISENAGLINQPGLIVCDNYLSDDIFLNSFEDRLFSDGFDVRSNPVLFPWDW